MYTSFFPFCTRHTKKENVQISPAQKKKGKRVFRYLPEIRRYYGGRGGALVISYIDSVLTLSEKVSSAMERKLFSWATVGRKSRNSRTEKKRKIFLLIFLDFWRRKKIASLDASHRMASPNGGEVELFMFFFSLVTIPTDGSSHVLLQRGPIALRYFSFFLHESCAAAVEVSFFFNSYSSWRNFEKGKSWLYT
jgi:hypothetical protein